MGEVDTLHTLLVPEVLIFESGGVESSLAEYEENHMRADMAFMKSMQQEVLSRQVFDGGDLATVVTHARVHGVYEGKIVNLSSTETLVMKIVGGQWQIVHIHWSSS
jgi:ketosteroid isomerase-like protein